MTRGPNNDSADRREAGAVELSSCGNPRIAKGDGEAPVRAYIDAMPGWKRAVGERVDELVNRLVPGVRRAVRWNTPFYGVEGQGWFLAFYCYSKKVPVTFLRGASLEPHPPRAAKRGEARYLDLFAADEIEESLLPEWIRQAAAQPGESIF